MCRYHINIPKKIVRTAVAFLLGGDMNVSLDSSLALILSMLREHGYLANDRNKPLYADDRECEGGSDEWMETIDFETGQRKRVRKMRMT